MMLSSPEIALPTQNIGITLDVHRESQLSGGVPKPGQIICVQCRNPVCEKSKWYCEVHLRLNRQAAKRCRDKKKGRWCIAHEEGGLTLVSRGVTFLL